MIESIISLVVVLVVLAVVWIIFKWIVTATEIPNSAPILKIGNLVFGAIALIVILRYLLTILPNSV